MKELDEILNFEQPTKYIVKSEIYNDSYSTPVLTAGKSFIKGYTNEIDGIYPASKLPVIIFDDFTTASKYVDFPFKVKSSAMKILSSKNDSINIKYVYYAMQNIKFNSTTHKRYWISQYCHEKINIPSIDIQNEIVNRLEKIEKAIELKQQQVIYFTNLEGNIFIDMFGDRYNNDKNWEVKKLKDVASFRNGKAHEKVVDENGKYVLITSKAISSDLTDVRKTSENLSPLFKNEITMVMSDLPNGRALAKCFLVDVDDKYTLNQRICAFSDFKCNPIYFKYLLNRHEYFLTFDDKNSQTNLRKDDILNCNLIIPPLELQNEFGKKIENIEHIKKNVEKNIEYLNQLLSNEIDKLL